MQKYEHAFGKNDIRGIYNDDITEELYYNIGFGYIAWLEKHTGKNACRFTNKCLYGCKIAFTIFKNSVN